MKRLVLFSQALVLLCRVSNPFASCPSTTRTRKREYARERRDRCASYEQKPLLVCSLHSLLIWFNLFTGFRWTSNAIRKWRIPPRISLEICYGKYHLDGRGSRKKRKFLGKKGTNHDSRDNNGNHDWRHDFSESPTVWAVSLFTTARGIGCKPAGRPKIVRPTVSVPRKFQTSPGLRYVPWVIELSIFGNVRYLTRCCFFRWNSSSCIVDRCFPLVTLFMPFVIFFACCFATCYFYPTKTRCETSVNLKLCYSKLDFIYIPLGSPKLAILNKRLTDCKRKKSNRIVSESRNCRHDATSYSFAKQRTFRHRTPSRTRDCATTTTTTATTTTTVATTNRERQGRRRQRRVV